MRQVRLDCPGGFLIEPVRLPAQRDHVFVTEADGGRFGKLEEPARCQGLRDVVGCLRDADGRMRWGCNQSTCEPTPYGERLGLAARESLDVLRAGLASNRPFDQRTTTRRFNIYASDIGQMVALPRLSTFLAKEAPGASACLDHSGQSGGSP